MQDLIYQCSIQLLLTDVTILIVGIFATQLLNILNIIPAISHHFKF